MTNQDWLANIENVADAVPSEYVAFILMKYGATCIEDLSESSYSDVWSELYLIAEDN